MGEAGIIEKNQQKKGLYLQKGRETKLHGDTCLETTFLFFELRYERKGGGHNGNFTSFSRKAPILMQKHF